jgi:O-antigen ligase
MSSVLALLIGICGLPALQLDMWTYERLRRPLFLLSGFFVLLLLYLQPQKRAMVQKLMRLPITYCMCIYLIAGAVSGLGAIDKNLFVIAFIRRLYFMIIPWLTGTFLAERPRDWMAGIIGYVCCSTLTSIYCAVSGIQLGFHTSVGDLGALHRNILADICASGFIIALMLLLSSKSLKWRIPLIITLSIHLLAIIGTQSRGGMIELIVGSLIIAFASNLKRVYKIAITLALGIAVVGAITLLPEDAMKERMDTTSGSSAAARPRLWSIAFDYIQEHPFHTTGLGNKPKTDAQYEVSNYCNWLLQDYIEAGLIAAMASLGIVVSCIAMAVQNHKALPEHSPARNMNLLAIVIFGTRYLHGSLETYWDAIYENAIVYYFAGYLTYTTILRMKGREPQSHATVTDDHKEVH